MEYSQSARHRVEFLVEKQSAQLKTPQAPTSVIDRFANEIGSGAREPDLARTLAALIRLPGVNAAKMRDRSLQMADGTGWRKMMRRLWRKHHIQYRNVARTIGRKDLSRGRGRPACYSRDCRIVKHQSPCRPSRIASSREAPRPNS